jgi:hypothetical protein
MTGFLGGQFIVDGLHLKCRAGKGALPGTAFGYARNVGRHFDPLGQPHARHFSQRRLRLLGSGSVHARANSALLWAAVERRTRGLPARWLPPHTHKLVKRRHESSSSRCNQKKWPESAQRSRKNSTGRNSQDYLFRTGPCSNRSNRWNLGALPLAGPAYRRVVARSRKLYTRNQSITS